jgi:hypothetical protein
MPFAGRIIGLARESEAETPHQWYNLALMAAVAAIVIVLALLAASGTTVLSRTSRAAAYVTLADLIEGSGWKRKAWPRDLVNMLVILLAHVLGSYLRFSWCLWRLSRTEDLWDRP